MAEDLKGDGGCLRQITGGADLQTQTCAPGDHIFAHYKGSLQDGTVFDSSIGKPHREPYGFDFTIGNQEVISGWDVGFGGMRVGQKATLTLNYEYAYGERGAPPQIPAKATLIFEVELKLIRKEVDKGDGSKEHTYHDVNGKVTEFKKHAHDGGTFPQCAPRD